MVPPPLRFVDVSNASPREQQRWPSILIPKEAIDAEVERLTDIARSPNGRRESLVVHPLATSPGLGLAPGIDVTISVLKPGEDSAPIARNSTIVDMCIGGTASATIGRARLAVEQFDVWNTPSMEPYSYRNDGRELFVRLSFSNAPLLEKLEVHYVDESPKPAPPNGALDPAVREPAARRARDVAESIDVGTDGAKLLGYEYLIDIDVVDSKPLLWPWKEVSKHLGKVYERDLSYSGRHLYVLYNPATERRMGTTHCFFATIAKYPPNKVDQPHRHSSAAINYYFFGHGKSVVMGERMEWKAGDLHLSAPGWAVHNHASREQGFCALTIQDHPLQLAMESLIWQETLKAPILKLGSQQGFETNLGSLIAV